MKKPTTSVAQFTDQLRCVATQVRSLAKFNPKDDPERDLSDTAFDEEFFSFSEPSHAPPRGRGQRVRVVVGWMWWPSEMSDERGATLVASKIREIPGVEEVAVPKPDPQFGFIWQLETTLRLSQ